MADDRRCATCKHFDRYELDDTGRCFYGPDGVQEDEVARRWGQCRLIVDTNDAGAGEPHSERAYPGDASGYRAWLMVREDFGCVEWCD